MRRRPDEHDAKQDQRHQIHRPGHRRPADHGRERPGRAADHDILRSAAFQPHRIDKNVEPDRQRQHRGGDQVQRQAHDDDRSGGQHDAEAQRPAGGNAAGGNWAVTGAPHHRVDVAVVPHVDRSAGPRRHTDAQHRGETQHRVQVPRRYQQADHAGEHHQAHDPRLEQGNPVPHVVFHRGRVRRQGGFLPPVGAGHACAEVVQSDHRIRGSSA